MKGRFYWSKRYEGGLKAAMNEFQNAIGEDADHAPAYSGLADTLLFRGLYSLERPCDMYPKAEAFIHKALSLDNMLAEAHTSLALIHMSAYWNFPAAENEFLRAMQLDISIGLSCFRIIPCHQRITHHAYGFAAQMDRALHYGVEY
jgi:tetratricopeptide (TPR) repeat protein